MLSTFLSVETIAFDLWGYQISWLECIGTIFNFAAVVLAARRNIWTWPIGIIGVVLFGFLFYQINLYADMAEQGYYLITGIIGWYMWAGTSSRASAPTRSSNPVVISNLSRTEYIWWITSIIVIGIALGILLGRIHIYLPRVFPEPADLPLLDAITTTTAFAAQLLMMQRKLQSWHLWIALDIVAVGLYWYKQVPFVAVLYALFLFNAIYGFKKWKAAVSHPAIDLIPTPQLA